jgi:hypothetical protein
MARGCGLARRSKSAAVLGYSGHQINVVVTAVRDPLQKFTPVTDGKLYNAPDAM